MFKTVFISSLLAIGSLFSGCFTIKTEHEVKPIQITVDVNLKVQRELDNIFGELDAASETLVAPDESESPSP